MVLGVLDNKVKEEEEANAEVSHWLGGCVEIEVNIATQRR